MELKQKSSSKREQAREQAGKRAGRQASTRKAFSRSHALEGLVSLFPITAKGRGIKICTIIHYLFFPIAFRGRFFKGDIHSFRTYFFLLVIS